jgi:flavin-dependent dehydrogenase
VAVVGAGIAGLAASVLLRAEGFDVVCLDGRPHPHEKVGESLDWSSPGLLGRLGIAADGLLADGVATAKRRIVVYEAGAEPWAEAPPPLIRRRPLGFETETLHVDRAALDSRVFARAQAIGTTFVWERVARVERSGDRVTACVTASGRRVEARWFLDASGTARVFSRTMGIPIRPYGRPKVCLWTYFDTPPLHDGTAFFVDNRDEYLAWIWDIPITPGRTSVGLVLPADRVRDLQRGGATVASILRDHLARHPRFEALLETAPVPPVERVAFRPYVTASVCGSNWLLVGEAASMPDPLTGNGVTSGIRHARHAVEAIRAAGVGHEIPRRHRRAYGRHVSRLGHAFNAHIERAIYRSELRHAFGLRSATYVYTLFAFFVNALHARFDPRGVAGMAVFGAVFAGARAWIEAWGMAARVALWCRRPDLHGDG